MSDFAAGQLEEVATRLERQAAEIRARARALRAHGPEGAKYLVGALLDMAAEAVEEQFPAAGAEIPARLRTFAASSRGEPTHVR